MKELKERPENFYVIHYSCESLYDENEALSPKITSIAVTHYATEQTVSFSTHAIAEELHIAREQVREKFDEIEKKLLTDFYDFVRDRRDKHWVHWNMRNLTFGFEHLEHRYRVLGGANAPVIAAQINKAPHYVDEGMRACLRPKSSIILSPVLIAHQFVRNYSGGGRQVAQRHGIDVVSYPN